MNSLRKWLYKPRRDDKSLLAKFWYADDNLNQVAAELDSFDGRKDPERCAALVSRLRHCQDKLLTICNKMLEELNGENGGASREFRQKFPDEIVTDNLGGQLWFGAECLAAGSSIMNKEFESEQMRPLAKAVTKSLEKVRSHMREQCLSPSPQYTEDITENLKIFDRLFAEFEFSYVSCMVHVKSVSEYEMQQDVICLFSDTLQRAITNNMISQDMVDMYDPSLMFAIPRLAIVCGLVIFPKGPLNVDRDSKDFPELFRPFKNLLKKIRDLLWTLTPGEFLVLERLLCQLEEPNDLEAKLKVAQQELNETSKLAMSLGQAEKLDAKLAADSKDKKSESEESGQSNDICDKLGAVSINCDTQRFVEEILDSLIKDVVKSNQKQDVDSKKKKKECVIEIDCSSPDIRVKKKEERRQRTRLRVVGEGETSSHKRKGAKKYSRSGKDVRARFKSSEDLVHRLYVCISGAADQLQTNFAGDFRSILKHVFIMNGSYYEEPEEDIDDTEENSQEETFSVASAESDAEQDENVPEAEHSQLDMENPDRSRTQESLECGEDALMSETEQSYLRGFGGPDFERPSSLSTQLLSTSPPSSLTMRPVYASNLGYHMGQVQEDEVLGQGTDDTNTFYQPEPTLLNIASGDGPNEEQEARRSRVVEPPPPWVPDHMAPLCMGCGTVFNMVRRRHHCRACGRVFCAKCSHNQVPLPRYGMKKAVRVCNRCYIYYMNPYEERTAHAYHVYSGTGHGSWGYSGMVS